MVEAIAATLKGGPGHRPLGLWFPVGNSTGWTRVDGLSVVAALTARRERVYNGPPRSRDGAAPRG
jgi:hypothetical protein